LDGLTLRERKPKKSQSFLTKMKQKVEFHSGEPDEKISFYLANHGLGSLGDRSAAFVSFAGRRKPEHTELGGCTSK
jgi:hypothetical protein